jgi:hypothetical protein
MQVRNRRSPPRKKDNMVCVLDMVVDPLQEVTNNRISNRWSSLKSHGPFVGFSWLSLLCVFDSNRGLAQGSRQVHCGPGDSLPTPNVPLAVNDADFSPCQKCVKGINIELLL